MLNLNQIILVLESENVTFDRNKETAQSYENRYLNQQNTMISSNGFDIYDNGNKINSMEAQSLF